MGGPQLLALGRVSFPGFLTRAKKTKKKNNRCRCNKSTAIRPNKQNHTKTNIQTTLWSYPRSAQATRRGPTPEPPVTSLAFLSLFISQWIRVGRIKPRRCASATLLAPKSAQKSSHIAFLFFSLPSLFFISFPLQRRKWGWPLYYVSALTKCGQKAQCYCGKDHVRRFLSPPFRRRTAADDLKKKRKTF